MVPIEERALFGSLLIISIIKLISTEGCNTGVLSTIPYSNHIQAKKEYDVLR
jgi:hypothetical protein